VKYTWKSPHGRSRWPCRLRRRSEATRLLGLGVRIPPCAYMSVSVNIVFCLCNTPIPPPEESYREWCVCAWSRYLNNEAAWDRVGLLHRKKKKSPHEPTGRRKRHTFYLYLFMVRFPIGARYFLFSSVQSGAGAHPAFYSRGSGAEWTRPDADYSPPLPRYGINGLCLHSPHISSWHAQEQLYLRCIYYGHGIMLSNKAHFDILSLSNYLLYCNPGCW